MHRNERMREPLVDRNLVVAACHALRRPGTIIEVRALEARLGTDRRLLTYGGYFDSADRLADAIASFQEAGAIYVSLNEIEPSLLARSMNKIRVAGKNSSTTDSHVTRRVWLLIDTDPERVTGIASSDAEHEAALSLCRQIADFLRSLGWPEPVQGDSGNGGHLLYGIDLPADDGGLVESVLNALSGKFDSDQVCVDTTVHNPSRIVRLYGCLNGKGDSDASAIGRPQRRARLLSVPENMQSVTRKQLENLVALLTEKSDSISADAKDQEDSGQKFDIENWIATHQLDVKPPEPWKDGGRCWVFHKCPWNAEHEDGSAYIVELADGKLSAGCHHNSCTDKNWHALRDVVEPGWRDKKKSKVSKRSEGGGITKRLADAICKSNHFAQDLGGKLYHFARGVYAPRGEEFVRRRVKSTLNSWKLTMLWSPTQADAVVEYIRVDSPLLWERPPEDVLNVQNGLLDVVTRELKAHSPQNLSAVQLPVKYDPAATCPEIDKFVEQTFPEDAASLAWEIPAYLMLPATSIQMAVLLIGRGGNGKSTWLTLLISFLGRANISGVSLHKLESDRFAASRLYGKLANICPDLPSEHLAGTSIFKSITGGDIITGEYKFKDSFDFLPFARLVFSANTHPRSEDSSEAFFDRWLVIPFERSFRGTDQEVPRATLDAKLASPSELSGLLNRALDAHARLRQSQRFSRPESVQRAWQEFHATTDPLAVWLDRFTTEGPNEIVVKKKLRIAFNTYLESRSRPVMADAAFGTAFAKLRPNIERKQRMVNGKLEWCYVGIGMSSEGPDDSHTSQTSQGSPTCYQSHAREENPPEWDEGKDEQEPRTYRGNPVKSVNPVMQGRSETPVVTTATEQEGECTWKV